MSITIEDRIILVLKEQLASTHPSENTAIENQAEGLFQCGPRQYAGHGFWEKIASETGVPSQRWRSVFTRRQKPTPAMIESLAKLWPQYGFWIATGITDAINGHVAPVTAFSFPERLHVGDPLAESYFQQAIKLNEDLLPAADFKIDSEEERLDAVERKWKFGRWREGGLLRAADLLRGSFQYERLIDTWKHREGVRPFRLSEISHHSKLGVEGISGTDGGKNSARATRPRHDYLFGLFYNGKGADDVD